MKTLTGNLITLALEGRFDVIVHGCNCQCTMGAGIAKTIKQTFPEAFEADRATKKADRSKLGTFSAAQITREPHTFAILNAYTQFHFQGPGPNVDYAAIRSVFRQVKKQFTGQRIAYPKIGAGLAGGGWPTIAQIIDEELAGEDHTLIEYTRS